MSGILDQMTDERVERLKRKRFGLYRSIVRDVEDPEGRGRIRAEIHELLGSGKLTNWASYCAPLGGGGAGFFMLPRPGDGVWMLFERGEPTRPVWLGFWYNTEDSRPQEASRDVRVLRSRSGHQIAFGDEEGREYLEVRDHGGNSVRIDSTTGDILVQSAGSVTVQAAARMTIDAPEVQTTTLTNLAGGGRRVARVGDLIVSRGHIRQVGRIRTGAARTRAS